MFKVKKMLEVKRNQSSKKIFKVQKKFQSSKKNFKVQKKISKFKKFFQSSKKYFKVQKKISKFKKKKKVQKKFSKFKKIFSSKKFSKDKKKSPKLKKMSKVQFFSKLDIKQTNVYIDMHIQIYIHACILHTYMVLGTQGISSRHLPKLLPSPTYKLFTLKNLMPNGI